MAHRKTVPEYVQTMLAATSIRHAVVAVSGGPDSVALLSVLHKLMSDRLTVVHVNHCLRGAAGEADELFVRDFAASLGVPYLRFLADVHAASSGRNIEATARRMRYEVLFQAAREVDANVIVTGHNADDQAETVLYRMIRGTGLAGLAGILPRYRHGKFTVVRPLLHIRRRDLIAYLDKENVTYRIDETNRDVRFARNRIRWEVMPGLESMNSHAVNHFGRVSEMALRYRRRELSRASRALQTCEMPRAGSLCVIDHAKVKQLSDDRSMLLWRTLWRRENWPRTDMGFREWSRLAAFAKSSQTAIDLPGGIRARNLGRVLRIGPELHSP